MFAALRRLYTYVSFYDWTESSGIFGPYQYVAIRTIERLAFCVLKERERKRPEHYTSVKYDKFDHCGVLKLYCCNCNCNHTKYPKSVSGIFVLSLISNSLQKYQIFTKIVKRFSQVKHKEI